MLLARCRRDLHPAPTPSVQVLLEGKEGLCRETRGSRAGRTRAQHSCSVWPSPRPHLFLHGEFVRSRGFAAYCCPRCAGSVCSIYAQPGGGLLSSVPPGARGTRNFGGRGWDRGGASGGWGRSRGGVQWPQSPRPQFGKERGRVGVKGRGRGGSWAGRVLSSGNGRKNLGGAEVAGRGRREVSRTKAGRGTGRG